MLSDMRVGNEPVEDVFHRLMVPMVNKHGEVRLQRLADEYRLLTADLQTEALAMLKQWKANKGL